MTTIDDGLETMLALTGSATEGSVHAVPDHSDALFTWDYAKGQRPALEKLYEKAKTSQWNSETDLDWSTDVDPERVAHEIAATDPRASATSPTTLRILRSRAGAIVSGRSTTSRRSPGA